MYVPDHFAMESADARAYLQGADVAQLVTLTSGSLNANLLPVYYDEQRGPLGALVGHVAKANPQWRDSDAQVEALAIVSGPDAYVSPSVYASKAEHGRVVPTWNFVAVHAYGVLEWIHDSPRKLEIVSALTDRHERRRMDPWQVSDAPQTYIDSLLNAIVAFEFHVTRIEGKAKLSQNRSEADRVGVVADLGMQSSPGSLGVAQAMKPNVFGAAPGREF